MKNKADYSKYECPYSHLEKESGHELHGPEGYQDVYGVWCACGFKAPVFYLDPDDLGLKLKEETETAIDGNTVLAVRCYQIDFGNHLRCKIKVTDSGIEVEGAINGWGDGVPLSEVIVVEMK